MENKDYQVDEQNNNGDGDFESFVEDMAKKGIIADGDKIAREGLQMLAAQPGRPATTQLLISVVQAESLFKREKIKGIIADCLARAVFQSREEQLAFLDYFEWCDEFEQDMVYCLLYLISTSAIDGRARQEAVAALTSFNHTQRTFNYDGKSKISTKDKSRSPGIS